MQLRFLILTFVIAVLFQDTVGTAQLTDSEKLSQLQHNSVVPWLDDSQERYRPEFKEHLRTALRNVRIVALGESLHDDGATFEQKVKLVKYLHNEHGFNVLAFEYGFLGEWKNNQEISRHPKDLKTAFQYSGWSRSKYGNSIYRYIAATQTSGRPLILAGFDGEKVPDGIPNTLSVIKEIADTVGFDIDDSSKPEIELFVKAIYGRLGNIEKEQITAQTRNDVGKTIRLLADRMTDQQAALIRKWGKEKFTIYRLSLASLLMDEKETFAGAFRNIVRDKHMADRLNWLMDTIYPDEKVILWGASAHFARNMVAIDRTVSPDAYGYYPYYQMGDWVYTRFKDQYYSIAFVAGSGSNGLLFPEGHKNKSHEYTRPVARPQQGSFENIALMTSNDFLYTDLRSADRSCWLSDTFDAYPLGYQSDRSDWKEIFDAFYFIREMKPDEWEVMTDK